MARVKAMPRGAAAAAEAEQYRPELVTDEEPRYLRRQRPLEIRRKKFGSRSWPFYRQVAAWSAMGLVGAAAAIAGVRFHLYSPQMLLRNAEQIDVRGNHIVSREAVLQQFLRDRNRSIVSIPLDKRRSELEQIPWVESASVQRILPNHLRVELTERTPIAFLRNGNVLALIDPHGVILDRPQGEDLQFPIVSGVSEDLSLDQREKRMQVFQEFIKDVDLVRAGSSGLLSEADLSNPKDLRVVMTGLAGPTDSQPVTVHFGSGEFTGKYKMLVDNFSQWQANAGRVQSIDLQYMRQVVVNPDTSGGTASKKTK